MTTLEEIRCFPVFAMFLTQFAPPSLKRHFKGRSLYPQLFWQPPPPPPIINIHPHLRLSIPPISIYFEPRLNN